MIFEVILSNFGFWANLSIPIFYALFLALSNNKYTWIEFGFQSGATIVYVFLVFFALFHATNNISSIEYYNSKITKVFYYEPWTERVEYQESYSCGTNKKPKTCYKDRVRYDKHRAHYFSTDAIGEDVSMSRSQFLSFQKEFGSKYIKIRRSNRMSYGGPGNKFISIPTRTLPSASSHGYENITLAAPDNIIHRAVPQTTIDRLVKSKDLLKYPKLYLGEYNVPKLNRILDTTKQDPKLIKEYLDRLNIVAANVGKSKQANPIIYITKQDASFKSALSAYWELGKKNDITLILGIDDKGDIQWSDIITFTNKGNFIASMQMDFENLNIKNIKEIILTFENRIVSEYVRKPMKEFEYLKENITLAWYWQLIILIGNIIMVYFLRRYFLGNSDNKTKNDFSYSK